MVKIPCRDYSLFLFYIMGKKKVQSEANTQVKMFPLKKKILDWYRLVTKTSKQQMGMLQA